MTDNQAEEETTQEESGAAIVPEAADERDQDSPRGQGGKTFLRHARESMEEHAELGRLLAESVRRCRESRKRGLREDLPDRLDRDNQPGRRSCPDP